MTLALATSLLAIACSPLNSDNPDNRAPDRGSLVECTVTNVIDGDTIDVVGCDDAGRVRLLLIDAPETSTGDCYANEATASLRSRLQGKRVGLERDDTDRDQYGRLLRYVWLGDEMVNESLVQQGFAKVLVFENVRYRDRISAADSEARQAERGLWGACGSGECDGRVRITDLDKRGEVVRLEGSGDLAGWQIVSERGSGSGERYVFLPGFVLAGAVDVISESPRFIDTASRVWWSTERVWSNSEDDDALLYDAAGKLVCEFDDGQ